MKEIQPLFQTTNHNCAQSALAMLLSMYGREETPDSLCALVPVTKNSQGEDMGSVVQDLATWCITEGYRAKFTTFDFVITDHKWAELTPHQMIDRMEAAKGHRPEFDYLEPGYGDIYLDAYIRYLKAGGELVIKPSLTADDLRAAIKEAPIHATVTFTALYGNGRQTMTGLHESHDDDVNGTTGTHAVVLYDVAENGDILLADPAPSKGPVLQQIPADVVTFAISSAVFNGDSFFFQIFEE